MRKLPIENLANKQSDVILIDMREINEADARKKAEEILFCGSKPTDKFDCAARNAFLNTVMLLMKDRGQLVKI